MFCCTLTLKLKAFEIFLLVSADMLSPWASFDKTTTFSVKNTIFGSFSAKITGKLLGIGKQFF